MSIQERGRGKGSSLPVRQCFGRINYGKFILISMTEPGKRSAGGRQNGITVTESGIGQCSGIVPGIEIRFIGTFRKSGLNLKA